MAAKQKKPESATDTKTPIAPAPAPDPAREVTKWLLAGQSEADILEAIATLWPDAESEPLIIKAIEHLTEAGKPDAAMIRGFALEGTREIYRKALDVGDHQTALRALKQMMEIAR